jgi:hypothetical protein
MREDRALPGRQTIKTGENQGFFEMAPNMLVKKTQCELLLGCNKLRFAKKKLWLSEAEPLRGELGAARCGVGKGQKAPGSAPLSFFGAGPKSSPW